MDLKIKTNWVRVTVYQGGEDVVHYELQCPCCLTILAQIKEITSTIFEAKVAADIWKNRYQSLKQAMDAVNARIEQKYLDNTEDL